MGHSSAHGQMSSLWVIIGGKKDNLFGRLRAYDIKNGTTSRSIRKDAENGFDDDEVAGSGDDAVVEPVAPPASEAPATAPDKPQGKP